MAKFFTKHVGVVLFLLLSVIIYFPVFLHLDYMPFRLWDESVLGVNALEMQHNHNYIVTYFYNSPDMYRCKPPLMLWVLILFTKLLGFSELSLRLPSALAAAALCMYLFFMLRKITDNYLFGFFAVCVLVTCQGYIGLHITRTGEYDSCWLLFTTVSALSLFMAVETEDKKVRTKHILLFFIFITLSLLTKGIVCMLYVLPGYAIYVLMRQKTVLLLKSRATYTGLAVLLVFGFGYYVLRETMNPGYIKAVASHELSMNFKSVDLALDGSFVRHYPVFFFLKRLLTSQFVSYMFIFPVALYVGTRMAEPGVKKIVTFAAVAGFIYLVVISLVGKKVPHYDAICIIYMCFIIASFLYTLFNAISKKVAEYNIKPAGYRVIAFLCVFSLLGKPYYDIVKTVYFPKDDWEGGFSESCRYFQYAARGRENVTGYKLIFDSSPGYGPAMVLTCYKEELAERGKELEFARPEELQAGDKAVVFDTTNMQLIEHRYNVQTLKHLDYCNADVIWVVGPRSPI